MGSLMDCRSFVDLLSCKQCLNRHKMCVSADLNVMIDYICLLQWEQCTHKLQKCNNRKKRKLYMYDMGNLLSNQTAKKLHIEDRTN